MKIGAQLFTVRDFTKTLDDFAETLKKIADIGYTTVQVSGTCPFEAEWLRDRLKETGLSLSWPSLIQTFPRAAIPIPTPASLLPT